MSKLVREKRSRVLLYLAAGSEMAEISPVRCCFGVQIHVDMLLDEVKVCDYDALALPGGFPEYGFYEDVYDDKFLALLRQFDDSGKHIAAICVGALPLGRSGILIGRRATTYHLHDKRRQRQLAEFGAHVMDEPVVTDRNIITSWCPSTAFEVSFHLLAWLTSEANAAAIRQLMGF